MSDKGSKNPRIITVDFYADDNLTLDFLHSFKNVINAKEKNKHWLSELEDFENELNQI